MEKEDATVEIPVKNVRIAHKRPDGVAQPSKPLIKPKRKTPAEVMMERYQKLREEEEAIRQKMALHRQVMAKHAKDPSLAQKLNPSSSNSSSSTLRDRGNLIRKMLLDIANFLYYSLGSGSKLLPEKGKRIARPPSNVAEILKSKERIKNTYGLKASSAKPASSVQSSSSIYTKGEKRIAHRPNLVRCHVINL